MLKELAIKREKFVFHSVFKLNYLKSLKASASFWNFKNDYRLYDYIR